MDKAKMKIVYAITSRDRSAEVRGGRKYWNRIGVAFVNSDGSLNVKLEALPVSGELHIRDYVPRDDSTRAQPSIPDTALPNISAVA